MKKLKITIAFFILFLHFHPKLFSQNEYVKRINHPGTSVFGLHHPSFIKDDNYYTLSHYNNNYATEESSDFQKTDLLGNIQPRTPSTSDFNIEVKPLPFTFGDIHITSYIAATPTFNYFIGYSGYKGGVVILGEIDNFGNFSNLNYITGPTACEIVINKMILHNNFIYAVGSFTNNIASKAEFAVFKFDLAFNAVTSYTISSFNGSSQFDDEISEGLDLIVDQNEDLCVVGNIYEAFTGTGINTSIFGAPLVTAHNYAFFCKINMTTNVVSAFKIFGVTVPSLESLMFRRLLVINGEYYVFGNYEYLFSLFQPLIVKLDASLNILTTKGFGNPSLSSSESIMDVVNDVENGYFYAVTRGFNVSAPISSQVGMFSNTYFMRNINNQGSLYKINSTTLIPTRRRQLKVSSTNIVVGFESICLSKTDISSNDRLIITGMNNNLGTNDKNIWYINTNSIDNINSNDCSKIKEFDHFAAEITSINASMTKINLGLINSIQNFDIFQLNDNNECEIPLTNSTLMMKSINHNSNNQIECVNFNTFEKLYIGEQNTITYKSYKIFSVNGKLIYNNSYLEKSVFYSVSNGIYLIQLIDENDTVKNIKLLINN